MQRFATIVTVILVGASILLISCAPSDAAIQEGVATALAATQAARSTEEVTASPIEQPVESPTVEVEVLATETLPLTTYAISTPSPDLIDNGKRCIDEVTYDSFIYADALRTVLLKPAYVTWWVQVVNETPALMLLYSYRGNDWLFVNEIIFNIDGEVKRVSGLTNNRDVLDSGQVSEIGSVALNLMAEGDWLMAIENADSVIVRLSGSEGNEDVELYISEKQTLQYALVIYSGLVNGLLDLEDIPEGCL